VNPDGLWRLPEGSGNIRPATCVLQHLSCNMCLQYVSCNMCPATCVCSMCPAIRVLQHVSCSMCPATCVLRDVPWHMCSCKHVSCPARSGSGRSACCSGKAKGSFGKSRKYAHFKDQTCSPGSLCKLLEFRFFPADPALSYCVVTSLWALWLMPRPFCGNTGLRPPYGRAFLLFKIVNSEGTHALALDLSLQWKHERENWECFQ
jgi:hypothetical protein